MSILDLHTILPCRHCERRDTRVLIHESAIVPHVAEDGYRIECVHCERTTRIADNCFEAADLWNETHGLADKPAEPPVDKPERVPRRGSDETWRSMDR